jgi:hypothetical protein
MNARDAMDGGGKLTLRAQLGDADGKSVSSEPTHASIEVRDTGKGMPAAVQRKVFEPFFTTKGDKGTGLGLTSVRESVEGTGGRVRLESRAGRGTVVTVVLPLAAAQAAVAKPPARAAEAKVLVVEEPSVRTVLLRALRGQGRSTVAAGTANEGLAALRAAEIPFSMLVVGSTSRDEAQSLVQVFRSRSPGGQVILCENDEASGADESDGVTTLVKPFTLPELLRHIESRPTADSE